MSKCTHCCKIATSGTRCGSCMQAEIDRLENVSEINRQAAEQSLAEIEGCIQYLDDGDFPSQPKTELERKLSEAIYNHEDTVTWLEAQNERLKSRGIEDMQFRIAELEAENIKLRKMLEPIAFLPECKWQGDDGKNGPVIYCYKDRHERQGKPCSKRCDCPEPEVKSNG